MENNTQRQHRVYVGVGSNLPEALARREIECSVATLERLGRVRASETYRTDGVGVKSAGMIYYNAVVELLTPMASEEIVAALKRYEEAHGRCRSISVVTIDLDLVVFDGEVLRPSDFSHEYFLRGYRRLAAGVQ